MTREDCDNFVGYKELTTKVFGQLIKDWVDPTNVKRDGEDLPEANHTEIIEFLNSDTFDLFWGCFDINLTGDEAAKIFYNKLLAMPFIGQIKSARELGHIGHNKHIYTKCENCGRARWVQLLYGKPRRRLCHSCAGALGGRPQKLRLAQNRNK